MTDGPTPVPEREPSDPRLAGDGSSERELSERLEVERPVPAPEFRGALGRRLVSRDPGYGPRPAALRTRVAAYLLAGGVVMSVGALQATGVL